MGSLLVGVSFAKGFARSLGIPLVDVNHLQGHVMAHFIKEDENDQHQPPFYGNLDWQRMVGIIAASSYKGRPLSFELAMRNTPFYEKELERDQKPENIRAFLHDAHDRCEKAVRLFEQTKKQ